jgi:hypothetical protein
MVRPQLLHLTISFFFLLFQYMNRNVAGSPRHTNTTSQKPTENGPQKRPTKNIIINAGMRIRKGTYWYCLALICFNSLYLDLRPRYIPVLCQSSEIFNSTFQSFSERFLPSLPCLTTMQPIYKVTDDAHVNAHR